ncbi:GNAT family N-acetyltransferase [Tumebacillus algifaecis]|uniref:GNAT family N-acetyltransferase n=1 Tax=Tumebacillus algifaecis TaxID=1214604 RepID=A0A223CYH8_9BACL|nr:GNAT family N-acetyltransferase [Tumebacillus algifaecis]ASS74382.1 GNAT family N-acetyltransferase [Tumebacillus algifaecis]
MHDVLNDDVQLRELEEADLPLFFEHQLDSEANKMAAFTAKDPSDRAAFDAFWRKIRGDERILIKTILSARQVVGNVMSYVVDGRREVCYWIGKPYWGQGIGTKALAQFLDQIDERPLFARVAQDNTGSIRILEKCGFHISGEDQGFSNARGMEVAEYILTLEESQ